MSQPTILEHSSAPSVAPLSVSAGIAAANLLSTLSSVDSEKTPRFPGEDGGRSLAEIAQCDLDAALQLLADRAQYITGASGAAIALRRGQHADMLCRASAGLNAPELGALLSMEYGLSGESARTGLALRCDDVENDPRVNREGCRQLGIASVVVMPIISERQVLGVFELFSGNPHAFDERDVSALQRLGEMVETAVKQAVAAQAPVLGFAGGQPPDVETKGIAKVVVKVAPVPQAESRAELRASNPASIPSGKELPPQEKSIPLQKEVGAELPPRKPLFWSAAIRAQGAAAAQSSGQSGAKAAESVVVPPVLRRLQKCGACGFPVSPGRIFCVECEERQWRGQPLPQSQVRDSQESLEDRQLEENRLQAQVVLTTPDTSESLPSPISHSVQAEPPVPIEEQSPALPSVQSASEELTEVSASDDSAPFLSSVGQSESWFGANKYVLGALLVVGFAIGAIVWLR
jgi:hypothetical protein